jgi:zinc protease
MKRLAMKRSLGIGFAALLLPALALAQGAAPAAESDSVSNVELKGKVPVNPEILRVRLPRAQEGLLSNGVRVYLLEDHALPTFYVSVVMKGGGLADPPERRGLAMVTASLLREGTKQRSSREIAEQLATLGSSFSASASPSSGETSAAVSGLVEHIDASLAIAADIIRNPTFPQSELDKYKSRFAAQLQYQRSLPNFIAQEQFLSALYGEHPGSLIVPPADVIAALKSEDLAKFHATAYKANNAFILAHGDVTLKDLVAKLERAFGSWERGAAAAHQTAKIADVDQARVYLIDRPGSVQTSLRVGALGIERVNEDYFAVLVMNHILGGGPASRLFRNLREDKGYTYGVGSSFGGSTFRGSIAVATDVRTEVTADAMQELMRELKRIAEEPVSKIELDHAQRALVGRFALSLESPSALISNLATQKIYGLPDDYWDTYPQYVANVTPQDIQRVAKKYLAANRLQIVAVGDMSSLREPFGQYGEVVAVSAPAQ